jgi:L-fuconolactonase
MEIVDSHCHASLTWYEPVESLLHQMDRNGVGHAILIQMQGQYDNDYQAECVRRYPDRFTSVVIVDAARPDAVAELERHAAAGAGGVRLRPGVRSPGDDPLAIWRAAERLGLAVSCGGAAGDFADDAFAGLIEALSALPIVVEHLGSVNHPTGDATEEELRRKVFGLARYPTVHMKIHGLGEFCRRLMPAAEPFPFEQPIPPLLAEVYAAFGARRLMWGSDYPPVSGREGYRNALNFTLEQFADKTDDERGLIFGGVARAVFRARA